MPSIISIESLARGDERDGSPVVFRFRRSGDSAAELNVPYQLYGTALPGIDYQGAAVGSVNFGVGSTEAKLSLNSIPDLVVDPGETILAKIMPSDSNLYKIEAGKQFATETITAEGMVVIPRSESRPGLTEVERRNNDSAAALKRDGSVVLWGGLGDTPFWIDNNQNIQDVSSELSEGVVQIYATTDAFAALKLDGSVVTWGDTIGGNSSKVGDELSSGVVQISASTDAFAVLKDDGSVVRWGYEYESGNDSPNFASNLDNELKSNVVKIFSNLTAFAALKTNGSVVCWGSPLQGGTTPLAENSDVIEIFSTSSAFAALKSNGSVITWGEPKAGADSSKVKDLLKLGVVSIASTDFAFAALKDDGSVVSWGNKEYGGTSDNILGLKSSVSNIYSNYAAFAAIKEDGSVISWGDPRYGGDSSKVSKDLQSGVIQIFKTDSSFAALKSDGSLVTWGNPQEGGESSSVSSKINKGVVHVYSTPSAFAALKNDGSVVTWGNLQEGGDSSSVSAQLSSGVTQIFSTGAAFAALKNNGSVITWGFPSYGGDSSNVANSLADIVAFANPITDDRLAVTYLIKPTVSIINEGGQFSTNINTTNIANGTKLYWEFSGKGITSDDFDGGSLTGVALISDSKYNLPTSIRNDNLTEGSELLEIKLYSDDQRKNQIGNTSKVLINDSSRTPPTYIINTSASVVKEGEILSVEVITTSLDAGTMLYYRVAGREINTADLSEGFLEGEGKIGADGKYSFSIKIGEDKATEGKETLEIRLFANKERTLQVGSTKSVTILETPIPNPNPDPLVGPVLLEVYPGNGDLDVGITDNLVFIFSESIVAGEGLIILKSSDDGETLRIAAKDGIIFENEVYFQLEGFIKQGNSYTVSTQGEPFKDTAGMSWAGFTNTDYTFSTVPLTPPASIALKSDVGTLALFSAKLKEPLVFTRGILYQQPLTDLLGINTLEPALNKILEKYYAYNSPIIKPTKANDINQNFIRFGADTMDSTPVIIEIKLNDPVKADSYIVVDSDTEAYDFTYNHELGLGAELFDENNDGLVEKLNIYMKSGGLGDIDNIINNEYSQIGLLVEAPRLPVYRFYQPHSQQHFYTADINERNSIIKKSYGDGMNFENLEFKKASADLITGGLGYKYEGIAYQSFEMQATALYRFYNPRTTAHFWTADSNEAQNVIKNSIGNYDLPNAIGKDPLLDGWGYKYEGLSYKVLTMPQYGMDTAVYRFFQPMKGSHFYSSNLEEVRNIITNSVGREYSTDLNKTLAANPSLIPNGWGYVFEGKAFYI